VVEPLKDDQVFSFVEHARHILLHDLDPDFVEQLSIATAWEYSQLYDGWLPTRP